MPLYRRVSTEVQLESLRFLNCADVFTVSLINSAYASLVESNRPTLSKRAISIRYWQVCPSGLTDPRMPQEMKAAMNSVSDAYGAARAVGLLEIKENSGSNKRLFRTYRIVNEDEKAEHLPYFYPLPIKVKQMLEHVLLDQEFAVLERLEIINTTQTEFHIETIDLLGETIYDHIRDLNIVMDYTDLHNEVINDFVNKFLADVKIQHFRLTTNGGDVDCVEICASFCGETTLKFNNRSRFPESVNRSLMERIISVRYNPECQLLLSLELSAKNMPSSSLVRALFSHLYAVFSAYDQQISLAPLGVWLYIYSAKKESLSFDFWTEVLGGVQPSGEVSLPVPRGVYDEERECNCTIYELTAVHREQALRVCVGWTDHDDGESLLVQLKLL